MPLKSARPLLIAYGSDPQDTYTFQVVLDKIDL
jgi:hypothetical protein